MWIGFTSDVYDVAESNDSVSVHVVKNSSNDIAVSVLLYTTGRTAFGKYTTSITTGMNSTLHSACIFFSLLSGGSDYISFSSEPIELFFSPAESEQSMNITIPIINDDIREEMEQFTVQLSLPSGSTGVLLDQDSATVQIVDEDRECL